MSIMNAMTSLMALMVGEAVTPLYTAVKIALIVLVTLCALFLIIIILLQPGNTQGLGEIAGSSETFLGKNKAKTQEGRLKKATVVVAIVFVLAILALTIIINVTF